MSDVNVVPDVNLTPDVSLTSDVKPSNRTVYIIIGITALIIIIWIGIVIYSLATKKLLFPPFSPPTNNGQFWLPGGQVLTLTPAEIAARQAATQPLPPTS
jgi:hypothetical protein